MQDRSVATPPGHVQRRAFALTAGLAAAVPVILATVNAVRDGWVPGADQAIIATRAYDVFTSHPPLLGQYTLAGQVTHQITHSLGPMLFWLLALPARFGSPASMAWTMCAANTLAIVGAVALARRRGGVALMLATALAIALMCQSLAAETFHDVWNPSAGLFPFTLLIFLCWSLACGEHRLLPLTALVASFVVQAHLMYLPPTLGLLAVGLAGLLLGLRGRPRASRSLLRRALQRGGAGALVVLAVCWSAPVIQQVSERPGNFTLVLQSATRAKSKLGASAGWHAVVRAVGVQPWWLHVPSNRWVRKYDVRAVPSSGRVDSCLALLSALALVLLAGLARHNRELASGALIGFALCGALAAVAASTPTPRLLSATLGYTMWWGSQAGLFVWLILGWSLWLALAWLLGTARARLAGSGDLAGSAQEPVRVPERAGRARAAVMRPWRVAGVTGALASVAAIAAVGVAVAGTERPDEHRPTYRPTARLAAALTRAIPSGTTVELIGNVNLATMPMKPALRWFLVRHGVRVLARGSDLRLGDWYELRNRPYRYVIALDDGVKRPNARARLLGRARFVDGWGRQVVSLWIWPGNA